MQVGEFLKPVPPRREPEPPPPAVERPRDSLNYPKAPVAGYWRRVGALAFDFFLIYWTFRGLGYVLAEPLLQLGPASKIVGAVLVLSYFVLAAGPVGRGRTLGKFLVGIRVTGPDGHPPSLGRAALRTAALHPGILLTFFVSPLIFDRDSYQGVAFSNVLSGCLTVGLFVGTTIAIVFNPFKQGLHDFAARTLVQPAAVPPRTFGEVAEAIGGQWQRFHRQAGINGAATALLIAVLIAVLLVPEVRKDRVRMLIETEGALAREHFDPAVDVTMTALRPAGVDPMRRDAMTPEMAQAFYTMLYDKESTETLQIALAVERRGLWKSKLEEPDFRRRIENFADDYRARVFGVLDAADLFGENRESGLPVQNLRARPLELRLYVREAIYLFFPLPVASRDLGDVKIAYPPLEGQGRGS